MQPPHPTSCSPGRPPQIDRDPKHFPCILAYLRDGDVPRPEGRRERLELQVGRSVLEQLQGLDRCNVLSGWSGSVRRAGYIVLPPS